MIQRKQSLFLLGNLFLPLLVILMPIGVVDETPLLIDYIGLGLAIGLMVMVLSTILMYSNRPLQLRFTRLAASMALGLLAICLLDVYQEDAEQREVAWNAWVQLAHLPLLFLAARAIRRDEAMVRSMDRLRND